MLKVFLKVFVIGAICFGLVFGAGFFAHSYVLKNKGKTTLSAKSIFVCLKNKPQATKLKICKKHNSCFCSQNFVCLNKKYIDDKLLFYYSVDFSFLFADKWKISDSLLARGSPFIKEKGVFLSKKNKKGLFVI